MISCHSHGQWSPTYHVDCADAKKKQQVGSPPSSPIRFQYIISINTSTLLCLEILGKGKSFFLKILKELT